MPTISPGIRYPASNAQPNVNQDIQNVATDTGALLALPRFQTFARSTATASDLYTGSASLLSGTWNAAPPGDYMIHMTLNVQHTVNIAGTLTVTAGGQTLTGTNEKADVSANTSIRIYGGYPLTYAGGNMAVNVIHVVGANNVTVYNAGTKLTIEYLGRRS